MKTIEELTNKIFCQDCMETMGEIPDSSIGMILTDPPYGINYQSNMRTKSEKFSLIKNDESMDHRKYFKEFHRILKDNSVAVVFCSWKNYHEEYQQLSELFDVKNVIIWSKGGGGIGDLKHTLSTDFEMAIVAHKGKCHIKGKRIGTVWHVPKIFPGHMIHPTQKPTDLMIKAIENFADPDSIVFDPFLGSGASAVASIKTGRKFIGCEMEGKYCAVAKKQLDEINPDNTYEVVSFKKPWFSDESVESIKNDTYKGSALNELSNNELLCVIGDLGSQLKEAANILSELKK